MHRFSSAVRMSPVLALLTLFTPSCTKKQEEVKSPGYEVDNERDDSGGMEMMQEFGGMNEEKVQKTIERLYPSLTDCLMNNQENVEFLGGEVAFLIKVNLSGKAEVAHAEKSTLGSYETEQCMLDKLRESRWPKPVGGRIGLARTSIAFDPPSDVRPPVAWDLEDIDETLSQHQSELDACGSGGPFEITAYVKTNGSVLAAGIAHADDAGDTTASCLVSAVREIQFKSPGSWPAKVTFSR